MYAWEEGVETESSSSGELTENFLVSHEIPNLSFIKNSTSNLPRMSSDKMWREEEVGIYRKKVLDHSFLENKRG
jgi:hypothetical protein